MGTAFSAWRILLVVCLVFVLVGCDLEMPSGIYSQRKVDKIGVVCGGALQDSIYGHFVPAGRSGVLYAGTHDGREARSLLRFVLEDEYYRGRSADVDSIIIEIFLTSDTLALDDRSLRAFLVDSAWDEDYVVWNKRKKDTLWGNPGGDFTTELGLFYPTEEASVILRLPGSLFLSVVSPDPDSNKGIIVVRDGELLSFSSSEGGAPPQMKIYYRESQLDSVVLEDTVITITPQIDAFITDTVAFPCSVSVLCSEGFSWENSFTFTWDAVDSIPVGATVVSAPLRFRVDSLSELVEVAVYRKRFLEPERDGYLVDESPSDWITITEDSTEVVLDIAECVQLWVDGYQRLGFVIRAYVPSGGVGWVYLTPLNIDSIPIVYTLPPELIYGEEE